MRMIRFATSNASNATTPNSTRNTRNIEMRKSIVSKIVRSIAKRQRARTNAKKKDLKTTQVRNIESIASISFNDREVKDHVYRCLHEWL